ncbi:50S ribosomal protein L14e [Methanofervidicoccus sp. A16]|uniref:50S ribosomal protein L14e n=1 Tax=Methanofervidicoccus sp. A16 TaxID=2607662 RepID=UPI001188312B|nr:50S ribosomal protein L14e [Methanofervidicoccus sp. A16]AXI24977.1 50S ribosomal protein L14e [Methanofervidicoccus sp. A16]
MAAIEVGRVCVKTMGKEAGKICVIVDVIDKNFVLVDGNVKRRRCNIKHIEPTEKKVDIKKGASTEEVKLALDAAGLLK